MPKSADKTIPKKENVSAKNKGRYFYANGKRKTSIARVRLYPEGKGEITINERPLNDYFFGSLIGNVKSPLKLTDSMKRFDISAIVIGGGISSQSDAVRHAIAKALIIYDPIFRAVLKKEGFLTRDSRIKERKKPGLHRARRAPQWAKR